MHLRTPQPTAATAAVADEDADVRIDAGFVEGDTVTEAYDGMIAKLIVRGPDRATAIRRMGLALREYEVVGLSTNVEFLKRLCRSPAFVAGDVETGFIEKWRGELFAPVPTEPEAYVQAALALMADSASAGAGRGTGASPADRGPHGLSLGFGQGGSERKFTFRSLDALDASEEGSLVEVSVVQKGHQLYDARVTRIGKQEGRETESPQVFENLVVSTSPSSSQQPNNNNDDNNHKTSLVTFFPEARIQTTVVRDPESGDKISVFQRGAKAELALADPGWYEKALGLREAAASVVAPMPCKVLKNEVAEGDRVEKGTPLVV